MECTWYGTRLDQTFHWLRWWNVNDEILPWGTERVAQEQILRATAEQCAEPEKQRAEAEKQRADFAEQEITRLKKLLAEKS
ncbi:MAG: hypothetical protein VKL41_17750 [Snowella sp.]|nr:hypothetical protein [Snowella sp.]